jgi:hypothetical protein
MRCCAALTIICAALAAGCSFEPEPQPPGLLVATAPPGASCLLTRQGQTIAEVGPTPAIARGIETGSGVISIACRRPGFSETTASVAETGSSSAYPERVDIRLVPAPPR